MLAPHTCDSRKPSQERPPRAVSFPNRCCNQVLLSPRSSDKEGMARQAVIGGPGQYIGGPSGRPPSPLLSHTPWPFSGLSLASSSLAAASVSAGLRQAWQPQVKPRPCPGPQPQKQGTGGSKSLYLEPPLPPTPPGAPPTLLGHLYLAPHSSAGDPPATWRSLGLLTWSPPFAQKPWGGLGSSALQMCHRAM